MKRVLVSGGSRGIGKAIVKKFVALGYSVCFIYKSNDDRAYELTKEVSCKAIKADISDPEKAKWAVDKAIEYMGGIDILVSNAGISYIAQVCDTTDLNWRNIVDTNLSSAFYLAREVSRLMVRSQWGRIINIGSVWGRCGSSCEVAYSASKAGVRGLTMSLAKELAPSGITVNCVEPGLIDTDMNKCFDEETLNEICDEIPAGRMGKPSEVAELVSFLASDNAGYINGQCIGCDGGWCI